MEPVKVWYKSKTLWFNVAIQVAAIAAVLSTTLPMLAGIVGVQTMAYSMFGLATINQVLRAVTKTSIKL